MLKKFFADLFDRKSLVGNSSLELFRPTVGDSYSDSKSTEYYKSWIYAAAKLNSQTVADHEFKLMSLDKPKVNRGYQLRGVKGINPNHYMLDTHPFLDILAKPNNSDSLYSFIFKIQSFLELTGDSYVLISEFDSFGLPKQMEVLFSQYINIIKDGLGNIIQYNYGISNLGKPQYVFYPNEIIHIKNFDPNDTTYGTSPLAASARSQDLINSMNCFEEALNRNLGIPAGIIKYTGQKIREDDRKLVEAKWQKKFAGVSRAGKVLVTDQDIDYNTIGVPSRDMNFLEGRRWSREEIFACYGIPTALILTEGVNRANIEIAREIYYENTILPRLRLLTQTFTNEILNKYGISKGKLYLSFSNKCPSNLEREQFEFEKIKWMSDMNLLTNDECLNALTRGI